MNKNKIDNNDINNLTFEEALEELEKITNDFETGESTLENAVNLYNRGVLLKKHCEQKLIEAKKKIDEVQLNNKDQENKKK
ncbi:MAG: exodeoxyribonuclease VII small subunit [Pelagibacteraceae bacterium]|nr:exodeoxyribonuclease VII small subunit [Pelagibacteraceae bacterium]|tara:strand:+ start:6565 stop:6807 length:243 start_codon:yes stop_codon:yes gene_type:complete